MQTDPINPFKKLHTSHQALMLTNVWDAASAAIVENQGAQALATSSASVAWSNGYADGGQLPIPVLFDTIKKIIRVTNLPLSVDIEDGFNQSPQAVADLVTQLVDVGVVGINIEDGLEPPDLLHEKITAIKGAVGNEAIYINARTDVYLQALVDKDLRLNETLLRAKKYLASGADGIFVPGLTDTHDIMLIAQSIHVPLNIMTSSELGNLSALIDAGAKRISMGPNTFTAAYENLLKYDQDCTKKVAASGFTYESLNALF